MTKMTVPPQGSREEPTPRATWVRWHILAVLMAYSFMSWFNRVSMPVAYDLQIQHQVAISDEQIGYVYSAFFLAYAVCMTPGGWLADRYGAWAALAFMGFGSALFGALTGFVGLVPPEATVAILGFTIGAVWLLLLIVRFLMGLFTAPIYPAGGRAIFFWVPPAQRAWANGLINGSALLGNASTFVVFGYLIDRLNWPGAFLVTGAMTGLLALLWTVYATNEPARHRRVNRAEQELILGTPLPLPPEPGAGKERATQPGHEPSLFRNRSLVLLTLSYAAVGYFEYLFYFWVHHYFEDVLVLGKDYSKWATTFVMLAMAGGTFAGGWLSDRFQRTRGVRRGRRLVPMVGMLAGAGLLVLGLWAEQPILIVVWFALALAAVGASEGPFWATAIELGGPRSALAAGIFNTGGNVGGLVAPALTPWLKTHLPGSWDELLRWKLAISVGALVCLIGVGLWFWIDPQERADTRAWAQQ